MSLHVLLCRISEELAADVDISLRLQDTVSELMALGSGAPDVSRPDLQTLDHLTQSLECLRRFLLTLSRQVPQQMLIETGEAGAQVFLRELAGRLVSASKSDIQHIDQSGDLDLF